MDRSCCQGGDEIGGVARQRVILQSVFGLLGPSLTAQVIGEDLVAVAERGDLGLERLAGEHQSVNEQDRFTPLPPDIIVYPCAVQFHHGHQRLRRTKAKGLRPCQCEGSE